MSPKAFKRRRTSASKDRGPCICVYRFLRLFACLTWAVSFYIARLDNDDLLVQQQRSGGSVVVVGKDEITKQKKDGVKKCLKLKLITSRDDDRWPSVTFLYLSFFVFRCHLYSFLFLFLIGTGTKEACDLRRVLLISL